MKFEFRISGGIKFEILDEDSGDPSSVTISTRKPMRERQKALFC